MASAAISSRLGLRPWRTSRVAACSRSLRVRRRWLGRPCVAVSMAASVLGKLLQDGGQGEPHGLPLDLAGAGELHHVQEPELERPVAALQAERAAGGAPAPQRLIDQEILAVQAAQRPDLAIGEVREQVLVEAACVVSAMGWA